MEAPQTVNLEKIIKILKEHKDELKLKYGIREIGIFGSYVRGEEKYSSDIDILVDFDPDVRLSLLDFIELEIYLSDLLGIKVDLVDKQALKPKIGRQVLNELVVV